MAKRHPSGNLKGHTKAKTSVKEIIDLTNEEEDTKVEEQHVFVQRQKGEWSMEPTNTQLVLVISDGAGTYQNRTAYNYLTRSGYHLDFVQTRDRAMSFAYPSHWDTGVFDDTNPNDLGGFGHVVGKHILTAKVPPAVIICGSRGSQVVLAVVMKHYWRGPFVAINAGPLTSNTRIWSECFPCFISCGRDFFNTKSVDFCLRKFNELADVPSQRGLLVHLPYEAHMPKAETLMFLFPIVLKSAIFHSTRTQIQALLWPPDTVVYEMYKNKHPLKIIDSKGLQLANSDDEEEDDEE